VFGSGEYAAMYGPFTDRWRVRGKRVTTPIAVFAKLVANTCFRRRYLRDRCLLS
jgi:hypothetical protein